MVDLYHLHEGVEGGQRLARIELLEPQVVEEDVPAVHPQDREGSPGERRGWGAGLIRWEQHTKNGLVNYC